MEKYKKIGMVRMNYIRLKGTCCVRIGCSNDIVNWAVAIQLYRSYATVTLHIF